MAQKTKMIIGIIVLVVLIASATIAYNTLGKQVRPNNNLTGAVNDVENTADAANKAITEVENEEKDIELAQEEGSVNEEENNMQKAPDFTMKDNDGNLVLLSEMIANNKPLVLNFWASWCPPCKSEMPDFDAVYKELGENIQFVMVNMTDGQRETVEIGTKYIEEQGYSFPVYFDTAQEGALNYRISSIPTTIFINADGYMVTGAQGAIDEDTLRKGIDMIR